MNAKSSYKFSIVECNGGRQGIRIRTGNVRESYLEPVSESNLNFIELYKLSCAGDGTSNNSRLADIGLVDKDGHITEGGSMLVNYIVDSTKPELVGLQHTFEGIDDKYSIPPTGDSGLDTNHASGSTGQIVPGEEVKQIEDNPAPTEEEESHTKPISLDVSDNPCDTLYPAVLGEFDNCDDDTLLKLNIDGTKCPVLYTSLDKREGYPGAVYVRIGSENAYCAGYVDESDGLVISPEGMYALLVNGNVNNIRNLSTRRFIEVFDGLTGTFRDMMGDETSSVALQMKNGTYRNVRELASGNSNLKPDGQLFVAALSELFGRERMSLPDGADERDIVPAPEFDISKYMPKNAVEPDNPEEEIASPPPQKPMTPWEILEALGEDS